MKDHRPEDLYLAQRILEHLARAAARGEVSDLAPEVAAMIASTHTFNFDKYAQWGRDELRASGTLTPEQLADLDRAEAEIRRQVGK